MNLLQRVPDCPLQRGIRLGVPKNISVRIFVLSAVVVVIKYPRLGFVQEWHRESYKIDLGHDQI